MTELTPRLEILPAPQRRLWDEFRGTLPPTFVLYGGTALALRTGSRVSQDFDFFSNAPLDAHHLRWPPQRCEGQKSSNERAIQSPRLTHAPRPEPRPRAQPSEPENPRT